MKPPPRPAERVRARMREWMDITGSSQREFASQLHKTQPWLVAILKAQNQPRLDDLDTIAAAMGSTAAELVRDDGDERYEFALTPSEVRVVQRMRNRPDIGDAVKTILDARIPPSKVDVDAPRKKPGTG